MSAIRTTCAYCGVGCGISATPLGGRAVEIKGDPDHPANHGKLCSKGTHLGETVGLEGRVLHPEIGGKRTTWSARSVMSPASSPMPSRATGRTASRSTSRASC
jgi:anaerobic selenocysteine-containing dehydrogenase